MGRKIHRFRGVLAPSSYTTMLARSEIDTLRISASINIKKKL
jgi:hypothetical protein